MPCIAHSLEFLLPTTARNCLTGSYPTELGEMTNLIDVFFEQNQLVGDLNPIFCYDTGAMPSLLEVEADCLQTDVLCDCCSICCNDVTCSGGDDPYTPELPVCRSEE